MRLFISTLQGIQSVTDPLTVYYVRPLGGNYGSEDGTSFDNAWDGEVSINWGLLVNKTLYAVGFNDGSITKIEPTTTIVYINSGIGVMVIGTTFQVN